MHFGQLGEGEDEQITHRAFVWSRDINSSVLIEQSNNEEKEGMATKKQAFCFWPTCERLVEKFLFICNAGSFRWIVNTVKNIEAWSRSTFVMGKCLQLLPASAVLLLSPGINTDWIISGHSVSLEYAGTQHGL